MSAAKGDARMADILRKALWLHVRKPEEGLVVTRGAARYRLADHEVREIAAGLRGTTPTAPAAPRSRSGSRTGSSC